MNLLYQYVYFLFTNPNYYFHFSLELDPTDNSEKVSDGKHDQFVLSCSHIQHLLSPLSKLFPTFTWTLVTSTMQ